ncbi:cation transporter [Corynebacterium sp. TAE3-ERU12]|uniref:heavy-metal-associated domain-containing protein n=1 Tax=Corynebacterium sp. TAE3-ERU12 TaxID=2849491 RepID=UPI001C482E7C|nr:cation transporter [Corynebacterium sp. TAE3-ERU12]MBV7294434.1 cation transporter [Corynebacterium sp. TAE3-ERU12]
MSTQATANFKVTGMSCGHCEASVREEVSAIAGVESVTVDHTTGELGVVSRTPVDPADVIAAVEEAGYEAEALG